jgi:sugar (pentulose or hexulose) kinase
VLLGIDIGTRNVKCGLYDDDGAELLITSTPTPWGTDTERWGLDCEALFQHVRELVNATIADSAHRIDAVGIASMGEVGVILDRHGVPQGPAIGWQDPRGGAQATGLQSAFGDEFASTTGRRASTLCSLTKVRWLIDHGMDKRGRWLGVAEWVAFRLGADQVAEPSLASRTGWFDIRTGETWNDALAWCGVGEGFLPEYRNSTVAAGTANSVVPGLEGALIAVAGHDHLAAMVGVGATRHRDVLDSCGTAEAIVMVTDGEALLNAAQVVAAGGTVSRHVVPGLSASFAPSFRSGTALSAVLQQSGVNESDRAALAELDERALPLLGQSVVPDATDLPTDPLDWPNALSSVGPAARWAEAIEGIGALGVARLASLERVAGTSARVMVSGGWATGRSARRVKEKMSTTVLFPETAEAGARGAALIAGVAAGTFTNIGAVPAPNYTFGEIK